MAADRRLVVLAALASVAVTIALLPTPVGRLFDRLANADSDGPTPLYNVPVDDAALRRAGALLPDDARYYIHTQPDAAQLRHDLLGAAYLYLAPAIPLRAPAGAQWVLSYGTPTLAPAGLQVVSSERLGHGIFLVRVR
jgi:hypothetical protein